MVKIDELIRLKNALFEEANKLSMRKGRGYGSEKDTFLNLKFVEFLEVNDAVRNTYGKLLDKIVRLARIIKFGEEYVGFEGFLDTVLDGINYLTYIPALKYDGGDEEFIKNFDRKFPLWWKYPLKIANFEAEEE